MPTPKKEHFSQKLIKVLSPIKYQFIVGLVCLFAFILSVILLWPGLMTNDTIQQLEQAKGVQVLTDWHPAILSILWRALIQITGTVGSIFFLQLFILWASTFLLSIYLYKKSNKFIASIPLIFSLSPSVLLISGVVWKDVHMAVALYFAIVLALYINAKNKQYINILLLTLSAIALTYASLIRHGALIATIPIIIFVSMRYYETVRMAIVSAILFVVGVVIIGIVLNMLFSVHKSNISSAVMLDDIVNISSDEQIINSEISPGSKKYILGLKHNCVTDVNTNLLFACGFKKSEFIKLSTKDYQQVRKLWISAITDHKTEYVKFRLKEYIVFLAPTYFTTGLNINEVSQRMQRPELGLSPPTTSGMRLIGSYERNTVRDFGFIMRPYFWLILNLSIVPVVFYKRKNIKNILPILLISVSGLAYILSYIISYVAVDYRYSYWLVFSTMLGGVLLLAELNKPKKA